ncbi:hypothetical protein J6590_058143 [Homalodisca vitripennis]|nr:hypothetical protein J6590_058143 [Homalodisca vitripennis]
MPFGMLPVLEMDGRYIGQSNDYKLPAMPFGMLPVLEMDGRYIGQSNDYKLPGITNVNL